MKILIIGSAGSLLVNFRLSLMRFLLARGYEVHAIASNDAGVEETLQKNGIVFHPISLDRHSISVVSIFSYWKHLRHTIKKINPDICLAYTIKPVIFGTIAAKMLGVKYCYALITGLGYAFVAKGIKAKSIFLAVSFLYKIAFHYCHTVIFQNKDDQNYCCQLGLVSNEKTAVVNGSGVDLSHFLPTIFPATLTFLMTARLLPEKGIFEYIDASSKLKKQHPNIRCLLVGYIDNVSAGITSRDIQEWEKAGIEYLGKQDDVREALSLASVFVLPSYREGTPRSVLEAMAMGRPIITTDVPGCRETVIHDCNGFLVASKSSDSLYEAMLRFVQHPHLIAQFGQESLRMVQEKFDVNHVNQDMLKILLKRS